MNMVRPTWRSTIPRRCARVARPTTVAWPAQTVTREPTAALPRTALTRPAADATSMVPCPRATTTPSSVAAPPAAGQSAATAAAAATSTRPGFNTTDSSLRGLPGIRHYRFSMREALTGENLRSGELAAQPDEQRLERERHGELELFRLPPGRPDELARTLCALEALTGRIGAELLEPVDVHRGLLGARRDDDEVAVPPLEPFEGREKLVPLCTALRAAYALLRLAAGELLHRNDLLGVLLRLRPALENALEQRLRAVAGVEDRIEIDRARAGDQC